MATVYKAIDNRLDRQVAIKFIRREAVTPQQLQQMLKRFEREAKSLARLSHPNIVKVHDYGEYEDMPYLVMEYLEGGTLRAKTGTPMPYAEAVHLLLPVARALEYAHNENIIHRDVKPANILLSRRGEPHLSDFGIAKILEVEPSTILTGTGVGVGTPEYMAPEQWVGKVVPQTDQYALGVVLFELVTGQRPYTADIPAAVLLKQATEPLLQPKDFVPNLPDEVERVIFKALNKAPEERYLDMGAFAEALESLKDLKKAENAEKVNRLQTEQVPAVEPQLAPVGIEEKSLPADEASTMTSPPAPLRGTERGEEPHPPSPLPYLGEESMTVDTPSSRSGEGAWGEVSRKAPAWLWVLIGIVVVSVLLVEGGLLNNAFKSPQPNPTVVIAQGVETATAMIVERVITATVEPATSTPAHTSTHLPTETPALRVGSTQVSSQDGMVMVYVPAGEFIMGSETYADEKPQRTVTLDAFWIDQTEVTNAMYARCMESGTCRATGSGRTTIAGYENYPVVVDKWDQAKDYCGWVGRRLPTEAEWEKAARGINGGTYPWGEGANCGQANYGGCKWEVQPVGSYPDYASPYGALDMAGNLWEWVSDVYPGTTDYMLKGGDWQTLAWGVRPAVRGGDWVTKGKMLWGGSWGNWDYCNWIRFDRNCDYLNYRGTVDNGFRCVLSP